MTEARSSARPRFVRPARARHRVSVKALAQKEREAQLLLELTRTLASTLDFRNILYTVVRRIAEVALVDRCSIVLVRDPGVGLVVAASDDKDLQDLPIQLDRYPEIRQVMTTGSSLVIEDATTHPLFDLVRSELPANAFRSVALLPLLFEDKPMGVLFLRGRKPLAFRDHVLSLARTVANATAIALRNARILRSLRDQAVQIHATAAELHKTKDFLERVIESSVDAIISADMRGLVLLFNRAAERIFGHRAEDVVGKMNARDLYPPGGAARVMRLIRQGDHTGEGRLEGKRTEILSKDGERIPVLLSAALIHADERPFGSVGIFTDLRERVRMEAQLKEAQDELGAREKQAALAELAGAAAHELNQPLTSVLGYAELIERRAEEGSPARSAASIILQEAERMADIVRKIGKITRYETKTYVGTAKILDLDRSSEEDHE